jgi:predicted P-loop ATPase
MSKTNFNNHEFEIDKSVIERIFSTKDSKWNASSTEYSTLNPLRVDKSVGSFFISTKGVFHDFKDNSGGSVVSLVMDMFNCTFPEALKELELEITYLKESNEIEVFDKWYSIDGEDLGVRLVRDRNRKQEFYWEHTKNKGLNWQKSKGNIQTTLYNLNNVKNTSNLIFCEGEGCAETLIKLITTEDFAPTTTGGVTSWNDRIGESILPIIKGKIIYILPDNDEPGYKYANNIIKFLRKNEIESYIVELPGLKDLKIRKDGEYITEKQDVKDWIKAGNSIEKLIITCESTKEAYRAKEKSEDSMSWEEFRIHYKGLSKIKLLDAVFKRIYEKKFNVVKYEAEFRLIGSKVWIKLEDREFCSLWIELNKQLSEISGPISKDMLSAYMFLIEDSDYNPFTDWCDSFESKETTEELDKLFDSITLAKGEQSEIFRIVITKWLVATFSLLSEKTKSNHICPVISGKQGIGKNTLIAKLFESLSDEYLFTGSINAENKDSRKRCSTMAVIHLDEFDATTKKDAISALKSLITSTTFIERLPFGQKDVTLKRRASLIASINSISGVLVDDTGNRRFPTFRVEDINLAKVKSINSFMLWSEIKYLVENEIYSTFFSDDELIAINEGNEKFEKPDLFKEFLFENYRPIPEGSFNCKITTSSSNLLAKMQNLHPMYNSLSIAKIGRVLTNLNYEQIRKGNNRYFLMWVEPQNSEEN